MVNLEKVTTQKNSIRCLNQYNTYMDRKIIHKRGPEITLLHLFSIIDMIRKLGIIRLDKLFKPAFHDENNYWYMSVWYL